MARPGDVIVVDGKGDDTCALFGELMVAQAQAAGLAEIARGELVSPWLDAALRSAGLPTLAESAH